jgi:hypothetical protein
VTARNQPEITANQPFGRIQTSHAALDRFGTADKADWNREFRIRRIQIEGLDLVMATQMIEKDAAGTSRVAIGMGKLKDRLGHQICCQRPYQ